MEKVVLWLSKRPEQMDQRLMGPKATSLCTLHRLGVKVPSCFFLTTAAFRACLDANGLGPQITARLNQTPEAPEEIRRIIIQAPLTGALREQIATAYNQLGAPLVAVRSSATAEDLPGHSFAGQYETV